LQDGGGVPRRLAFHDLTKTIHSHRANRALIHLEFGFVGARDDDAADTLSRDIERQIRGDIDATDIELGEFIGEHAREGPCTGLDRADIRGLIGARAIKDEPQSGRHIADFLSNRLHLEAALCQRGNTVAGVGVGIRKQDHGIGGNRGEFGRAQSHCHRHIGVGEKRLEIRRQH
jgi:hypothetical protein